MEKAFLVFVGGDLEPWELRSKYGMLIRRRKNKWLLYKWATENGYKVERNDNPDYEQ